MLETEKSFLIEEKAVVIRNKLCLSQALFTVFQPSKDKIQVLLSQAKSLICKYLSFSCSSGSDAGWTKQIRTHVQTGSGAEAAGDAAAAVGAAGAAQLDGSGHKANADLAGLPASISKYEH